MIDQLILTVCNSVEMDFYAEVRESHAMYIYKSFFFFFAVI